MRIILAVALATIATFGGSINLSTNANGVEANGFDTSGWAVTGTPGEVDGSNSGQIGPARVMPFALTLGSAVSSKASWISAGAGFYGFMSAPNGNNDFNHTGFYEFSRPVSVLYGGWLNYRVASNDTVYVTLVDGATYAAVTLLYFDSSASLSASRKVYVEPGIYQLTALVYNFTDSPVGMILEGNLEDVPEPMTAASVGAALVLLGIWRKYRT